MSEQSSNKTIAKNTIALYVRMGFSMIVSLYTSRVILQVLGVTDMGIYSAVGGVVSFVGFLNGALGGGSSRFLTFALGKGDVKVMRDTFSTVFWVHVLLAVMLFAVVETIGLWFLYNKLEIPSERMGAAEWVFHISALTLLFSMTQVPYSACVMAHEKMNMYAYTGIVETFLKLIIVYFLQITTGDKLIWYAFLFFVITVGIILYYRWYCNHSFEECKLQFKFDKAIFKPIIKYSGWQLFAQGAIALNGQGILILLNMFFSPAIVAARHISLQVSTMASQFMTNFRSAANPQIIKRYAAGDFDGSRNLLLDSTRYCYFLMLVMSLPIFLLSYDLLYLWLGQVPEYTDVFLKLVMVQGLFSVFDTGLYTAISAHGNIRPNALTSPTIGFIAFPVTYLLFDYGFSPVALSWVFVGVYAILGLVQKPLILIKVVGYKWSDFVPMYLSCLKVTIVSSIIPIFLHSKIEDYTNNRFFIFFIVSLISVLSVVITVWYIGLDKDMKEKVRVFLETKLHQKYA